MKIIYLANARMPTEKAHGLQIMKTCEGFSNQGEEVELVVAWRSNDIKKDIFDYYGITEKFKVKRLFSLDLTPLRILGRFAFRLQDLTFAISVFFYFLFKKQSIIYCRDPLSLSFLGWFRENIVYEMHTVPRNFFIYKKIFEKAKAIVAITQGIKDSFIKRGIDNDKILVAHDGVDFKQFDIRISKTEARKKLNLPLDKKIVIYAGLFDEWKGYTVLLQAEKFFNDREIKLVMIGGLEKQVEKLKKEYPQVIFLGYLPYADLPINQKAADVLVIPNSGKMAISKYFTSPLKLFSHMVSQRPIVASDLPSLREVLDENNAILVEPDNPRALARGIKTALKGTDFSAKIAGRAYQGVQEYTWEKRAKNILNFIKNDQLA